MTVNREACPPQSYNIKKETKLTKRLLQLLSEISSRLRTWRARQRLLVVLSCRGADVVGEAVDGGLVTWNSRPPRPPGVFLVLKSAESEAYSCPCSSVLKTTSVLLIFTNTSVPRRPRCRARLYEQNTWSCCVSWLSKTPSKNFASLSLFKSVITYLCFLYFAWPLTLLCFRTASRTMLLSRNSLSTRKLKGRLAAVTFSCTAARADK